MRTNIFRVSLTNMKVRSYEMRGRAVSTAATGGRIVEAARARLVVQAYDETTLDEVAADAGVTVQTVLRRFGSKEGLARAIADQIGRETIPQRDSAPAGDVVCAVAVLIEHYEQLGDTVMQVLRQELRVPVFAEVTAAGRAYHRDWVARVFAPWLDTLGGGERKRLHAQLVAACDVYTWFLLRRQAGLSRRSTEQAVRELVEGVLK